MNSFKILAVLFFIVGCSSETVKIHNRSDRFIDIEISKDNFYSYCADIDKKENKSIMSFYAVENDVVHEFLFRRISQTDWCLKLHKEYNKLIGNVAKIRLVGIDPSDKEKNTLKNDPIPEKFKNLPYMKNWIFIRLETSEGCKAYFNTGCDTKSYWGGLFPQK